MQKIDKLLKVRGRVISEKWNKFDRDRFLVLLPSVKQKNSTIFNCGKQLASNNSKPNKWSEGGGYTDTENNAKVSKGPTFFYFFDSSGTILTEWEVHIPKFKFYYSFHGLQHMHVYEVQSDRSGRLNLFSFVLMAEKANDFM